MFKSDRCGIETNSMNVVMQQPSEFKSDRCGIEPRLPLTGRRRSLRSNQTVAGLKLLEHPFTDDWTTVQIRPLRDWNGTRFGLHGYCMSGSNQTVAGLKQIRNRPIGKPIIVQIRPLRDWNYNILYGSTVFMCVQIRPLRDWNMYSSSLMSSNLFVQIRPLRDWNFKPLPGICH